MDDYTFSGNDYPDDLRLDDILIENNLKPLDKIKTEIIFNFLDKSKYRKEMYYKNNNLYIVKKDYSLRIKPNYFNPEEKWF